MKIEEKNEFQPTTQKKQRFNISRNIKRAVAFGVMFTAGVSAFAQGHGDGKLFSRGTPSMEAVNDMCAVFEYKDTAAKDGIYSETELSILNGMLKDYDRDYGEGAAQAVIAEAKNYMQSAPGERIMEKVSKGEISMQQARKQNIYMGVSKAGDVQEMLSHTGKKLSFSYEMER